MKMIPEEDKNYILDDGKASVYVINWFISKKKCHQLFDESLDSIPWETQEYKFGGRRVKSKRKVYAFGDCDEHSYIYSGRSIVLSEWFSSDIGKKWLKIRDKIHKELGIFTNALLLNYFPDGSSGITAYNDKEVIKGFMKYEANPVAELSLGATRRFNFKPIIQDKDIIKKLHTYVENGQLMVMEGETQLRYKHGIPYQKNIKEPRISAIFKLLPKKKEIIRRMFNRGKQEYSSSSSEESDEEYSSSDEEVITKKIKIFRKEDSL